MLSNQDPISSNQDAFQDEEEGSGPNKEERVLGALCYAHFFFLAPFFLQKDSEFLKFHMKQWGVLYALFLLLNVVSTILLLITGSLRFVWMGGLFLLVYTGFWVFVWYKAYLGEKYEIWFLSSLVTIVWEKMNEKK